MAILPLPKVRLLDWSAKACWVRYKKVAKKADPITGSIQHIHYCYTLELASCDSNYMMLNT